MQIKYHTAYKFVLSILMILLLFNNFFIPLDKILLPIYLMVLIKANNWHVSKNLVALFMLLLCYVVLVLFFNISGYSFLILYPILFLVSAIYTNRSEYITTNMISNALFVNIIMGLFFIILHYLGVPNPYTYSLAEKGLPNMHIAMGFSPTIQVYGTCCILWLILYFENNKKNYLTLLLVITALCTTLNRVSLLFFFLLLFYYRRKIFLIITGIFTTISIIYFRYLESVFFGTSTLDSRSQLREGFKISYLNSNNFFTYLLGKGNNRTTEEIAQQTYWGRSYIENGFDFLLHSYGVMGFLIYLTILSLFLWYLITRKQYKLTILSLFYFIILQWFTNEFLASTFFFFIVVILKLSTENSLYKQTTTN